MRRVRLAPTLRRTPVPVCHNGMPLRGCPYAYRLMLTPGTLVHSLSLVPASGSV